MCFSFSFFIFNLSQQQKKVRAKREKKAHQKKLEIIGNFQIVLNSLSQFYFNFEIFFLLCFLNKKKKSLSLHNVYAIGA